MQQSRHGNVYADTREDAPSEASVDAWMTGPFHQVAVIDPQSPSVLTAEPLSDPRRTVAR